MHLIGKNRKVALILLVNFKYNVRVNFNNLTLLLLGGNVKSQPRFFLLYVFKSHYVMFTVACTWHVHQVTHYVSPCQKQLADLKKNCGSGSRHQILFSIHGL